MAGIVDLNQIFNTEILPINKSQLKHGRQYGMVPEAPVFSEIPEIDTFLGGDGNNTLLDLQPSQWLPQSRESSPAHSSLQKKLPGLKSLTVSERGDSDDIYLGSQYPVVQKIGLSQVPSTENYKVFNPQMSQRACTPRGLGSQRTVLQIPRPAQVLSEKTRRPQNGIQTALVHTDGRRDKARNNNLKVQRHEANSQPGSQEDLFEDNPVMTAQSGQPANSMQRVPACDNQKDFLFTPAVESGQYRQGVRLRSVTEIPDPFRKIFNFRHFNIVQSKVFDDVMYTDKSLVLCSPTGSGKTAVFEMAIVRLMTQSDSQFSRIFKIIYMAPIKALCSERFADWRTKFEPFGLRVMELTGDTDTDDFYELQQVNIILTTPEKWDSMTRKWRDNKSVINAICLFLIDEIHVLNDASRGDVVEAVISRMKTIQAARQRSCQTNEPQALRFLAISATITNIEDITEWLGQSKSKAVYYRFDDSARPVKLRKVVLGYHFAENKQSEFQFDISLSYKLSGVINTYSEDKPTLIFCSTRKGTMQGAEILAKDVRSSYIRNNQHRLTLQNQSFHIKDVKLRDLLVKGIGYHHAGMDVQDRRIIEEIFSNGELPVLVATSTLAMGVNLPAHLVIIKSTMYYNVGCLQEYPDTTVLQMIGRAGRPQFDTSATAVIMTKNTTKAIIHKIFCLWMLASFGELCPRNWRPISNQLKYENLLNGTQLIESSLHKNLVEHLNAEIVLNTITDVSVAVEWLKYTFLYIRVMKNPRHYGMPAGLTKHSIEKRLQDMCMKSLNQLHRLNLIQMDEENMDVKSTDSGRVMARYCISYKTAELFLACKGEATVCDLLNVISYCEEFEDIKLRNNEKKTLNTLNKDKNRITIRYPMSGKVKTTDMKVNCLIQATFGSLLIQDFALQQDTARIFRAGVRITRCLVELLSQKDNVKALHSALLLCKCFKAKLWEDSKYVSKQLDHIGPTLSSALVNAGLTSFEKLEQTNPREIELIVNRHPPFGDHVRDNIAKLPKYELTIEQVTRYSVDKAEIVITIQLTNHDVLREIGSQGHTCTLLVGDADNKVVFKTRVMDALLLRETSWSKKLEIRRAQKGPDLSVHYISQDWVGLDVDCTYKPNYLGSRIITSSAVHQQAMIPAAVVDVGSTVPCNHQCHNKQTCGHDCCKHGITSKRRNTTTFSRPEYKPATSNMSKGVAGHLRDLKHKAAFLPPTPASKKRLRLQNSHTPALDLTRYAYTPSKLNRLQHSTPQHVADDEYNLNDEMSATEVACGNWEVGSGDLLGNTERARVQGKVGCFPRLKGEPLDFKKKADWSELDMFIKHRQNCNKEDVMESEDSLPDLDTTYQELADPGPGFDLGQSQYREEDIAQETDYGFMYVHSKDQPSLLPEWNDVGSLNRPGTSRISESNQKRKHSVVPNRSKPAYNSDLHSTNRYRVNERQNIYDVQRMPTRNDPELLELYESEYDIEDFSDDSFDREMTNTNADNILSNGGSPLEVTEFGVRPQERYHDDGSFTPEMYSYEAFNTGSFAESKSIEGKADQCPRSSIPGGRLKHSNNIAVQPNQAFSGYSAEQHPVNRDAQPHVECAQPFRTGQKPPRNRQFGNSPAYGENRQMSGSLLNKKNGRCIIDENDVEEMSNNMTCLPGRRGTPSGQQPQTNAKSSGRSLAIQAVINEAKGLKGILKNNTSNSHTLNTVGNRYQHRIDSSKSNHVGDIENIDPELHNDFRESHGSKWTDFFSSQSSTASDNLNWKYPARNQENQIVLEDCVEGQTQETSYMNVQENQNERRRDRCENADWRRLPGASTHKYGQILTWVSNPENTVVPESNSDVDRTLHSPLLKNPQTVKDARKSEHSGSTETKKTESDEKKSGFASFFTSSRPDEKGFQFSSIFEGIL